MRLEKYCARSGDLGQKIFFSLCPPVVRSMKGYGKKRSAPEEPNDGGSQKKSKEDEEWNYPSDPLGPVKPNLIHVMGEGDTNSICYIPLDPPDFAPIDADTLLVLVCSRLATELPDLMPSTMILLSHPDRDPLRGPHCLIHGGSTLHLASIKGRHGEPTIIFYKDLHLEVPDGQDPNAYGHEILGLVPGSHHIIETDTKERWLVPKLTEYGALQPLRLGKPSATSNFSDLVIDVDAIGEEVPRFIRTTSGIPPMLQPPPLPKLPNMNRILKGALSPKLKKRDGPPVGEGWGEDVIVHEGDWEQDQWEDLERQYDEEVEEEEDDPAAIDVNIVLDDRPSVRTQSGVTSWDTVLFMPDNTRLLHEVSVYGTPAADVLLAVCLTRGWNPADYRVLEHGLPIGVDLLHGSCSYDIRPRHKA